MTAKATSFETARERVRAALAEMAAGNPKPYIDCFATSPDATLFGAWGTIERGHDRLAETFRWVGSRFSSGTLVPEDVVAFESGDLAYTVGFERGAIIVDAGEPQPMTIRVTHIYRRIDGDWRLIHRHADYPPQDPRKAAGVGPDEQEDRRVRHPTRRLRARILTILRRRYWLSLLATCPSSRT